MKDSVLTTIPILPAELITEILSRVPVKSLLKFRSVSKSWLALISSPEFINTHLTLSTNNNKDYTHHLLAMNFRAMNGLYQYKLQDITVSSLLYESVTEVFDLDYPYKKLHNHFFVVGSVNGLICLAIEKYELVLWNPSIRKYKKLPDSKSAIRKEDCWTLYGFGYDELHDDYKVVAIFSKISVKDQVEVKIYSIQSNSWKKGIDECPSKKLLNISGKFVNGKLFWFTHGPDIFNLFKDGHIISIDLADEKWGKVEQPSYGVENFSLRLGVFESDFSVFCDNQVNHADVWVMKVYGVKESWTKMFTIKYLDDAFVDYDYLLLQASFISNKGEILVCFGSGKVMTYNPKNDSFRYSEVTNLNFDGWRLTEMYVESLVCPLSTKGRKNTTGKTQMTTIKQQIT